MRVERAQVAAMLGTRSLDTARLAEPAVLTLDDISAPVPKARVAWRAADAREVTTERAGRAVDEIAGIEVVTPGIAIHSCAGGRRWRAGDRRVSGLRRRGRRRVRRCAGGLRRIGRCGGCGCRASRRGLGRLGR